jgi:hypothetical protein
VDPLGLTPEQRAVSDARAAQDVSDLRAVAKEWMDRIRENLDAIYALPEGTMVQCGIPGCGPHPIEMYR